MERDIDVLKLINTFASKNKKYVIDYSAFAQAVQKQAKTYDQTEPVYRDLGLQPDKILMPKLFQLARAGTVSLTTTANYITTITLPEALTSIIAQEYRRMDEVPEIPFPDEEMLRLNIPPEWVETLSAISDLPKLVGHEISAKALVYRVQFTDGLKPILCLPHMLEDNLLYTAVMKLRNYLRKGANKDFIQQRMSGAFPNRLPQLHNEFTNIMVRYMDSVAEMKKGRGEFTYSFWAYLTNAVRKDLAGKTEHAPDDIAAFQASYIIDVYNNYYRNIARHELERDSAFKTLFICLKNPPYLYCIEDIYEFRDSQTRPLLGRYTKEELSEKLHEATTQAKEGLMPELLLIPSGKARGMFIAKDTLLAYISKAMREARASVKTLITNDWHIAMTKFEILPAMRDDAAFAADLTRRLEISDPLFASIIATDLPCLVYQEYKSSKEGLQEFNKYFGGLKPVNTAVLLELNRKNLLDDVKMMLPIWHTFPLIAKFVAFFSKRSKNKAEKKTKKTAASETDDQQTSNTNSRAKEFSTMALAAEKALLPEDVSLTDHLNTLIGRWNNLIDPKAKANLVEDINALVRDYLRTALRSMRPSSFTPERIGIMAANIANRPNLTRLRNYQAFEEYIRLYIIKVLKR